MSTSENHTRSSSSLPVTNITNFVSIQLDGENYLIWRHQFKTILQTLDLEQYVDSSVAQPSSNSPEFSQWKKLDGYVQACINATLHNSVAPVAIGVKSAAELWKVLETSYLQEAESDLVLHCLHGLNAAFDNFVMMIENSDVSPSFTSLKSKLLVHEQRIARQSKRVTEPITAMLVSHNPNQPPHAEKSSTICQICNKTGHDASICFHYRGFPQNRGGRRGGRTNFRGRGGRSPRGFYNGNRGGFSGNNAEFFGGFAGNNGGFVAGFFSCNPFRYYNNIEFFFSSTHSYK